MGTSWKEYKRLKDKLETLEPGTDAYDKTLDQFNKLVHMMIKLDDDVRRKKPKSKLSQFVENPALVSATGMLILGFATLYHERVEIITSRVFGMVKFK